MKKSVLLEAAIEFLQVKRELACTELRHMDISDEIDRLNKEMDSTAKRIVRLQIRRDELMDIIAAEVLQF